MEYKCNYESPMGRIILSSNGKEITGLWFESSRFIKKLNELSSKPEENLPIFKVTKNWLERYFKGEEPNPKEIPMKMIGTRFSKQVWKILNTISYGKTITYGEIAKRIAKENHLKAMSAQAVGHAVGHNPISILVPCHRVVGCNGSLTGYGGGIYKKVALLQLEKVNMEKFFIPKKGTAL